MPFRSLSTLNTWLAEFERLGYRFAGEARVIQQDGAGGADTGLVSVRLSNTETVITIEPEMRERPTWFVTMEPREESVSMDAPTLLNLSAELAVVSALCAFLQEKSVAFVGADSA